MELKGAPEFVDFCKAVLAKDSLTEDAIQRAHGDDTRKMVLHLVKNLGCWCPVRPELQRRVLWTYLKDGLVYPKGTTPRNVDRVIPVQGGGWRRTAVYVRPAPEKIAPPKAMQVAFTGSIWERRLSGLWKTKFVVKALATSKSSFMVDARIPEPYIVDGAWAPGIFLCMDAFLMDGTPLVRCPWLMVDGRALESSNPKTPARMYEKTCPVSTTSIFKPFPPDTLTTSVHWSIRFPSSKDQQTVSVLRLVRKATVQEIVESVVIRTDFHSRVGEDHAGVVCTAQKIPTLCPIGFKRIRYPARGRSCLHDSFFDLETFVAYSAQSSLFICPLCDTWAFPADLEMCDPFYRSLVNYPEAEYMVLDGQKFVPAPEEKSPVAARAATPKRPCLIEID